MDITFFEKALDNIAFFQSHPFLKPFIGQKYTDNELDVKILFVGESHYVKEPFPKITADSLLYDWWSDTPPLIYDTNWYTTRDSIHTFMSEKSGKGYAIYREPCKIYNNCVLNDRKQDVRSIYDSFAFMNYYQIPALYDGMSFWNSLLKFNSETNKVHPLSSKIFDKTEKLSNDIFLSVLDILKPDKIVFLSTAVYKAFKRQNKIYDINKIFATVHPTCPWWNRKKRDGSTGKQKLMDFFNAVVDEGK